MVMNKKEQSAFAEMEQSLAEARALRWVEPVYPDVPIPTGDRITTGWLFNAHSRKITQVWSGTCRHGDGPGPTTDPSARTSQNGVALFSTKARALQAMRFQLTQQYAQQLAGIDAQIAEAQQDPLKPMEDIAP